MGKYARVENGIVEELIGPLLDNDGNEIPVEQRFTAVIVKSLVAIDNVSPTPEQGWTYDGKTFNAPVS